MVGDGFAAVSPTRRHGAADGPPLCGLSHSGCLMYADAADGLRCLVMARAESGELNSTHGKVLATIAAMESLSQAPSLEHAMCSMHTCVVAVQRAYQLGFP